MKSRACLFLGQHTSVCKQLGRLALVTSMVSCESEVAFQSPNAKTLVSDEQSADAQAGTGTDSTLGDSARSGRGVSDESSSLPSGAQDGSNSTSNASQGSVGRSADGTLGSDQDHLSGGASQNREILAGAGSAVVAKSFEPTTSGPGGTTGGSSTSNSSTGGETGGTSSTSPSSKTEARSVELTQKGPGKVDILWIVDSSGSMAEEQQSLGSNFGKFIDQLNAVGTDFQTAVTTTDICEDQMPVGMDRVCPLTDAGGSAATHLRGSFVGNAGHKVLKSGESDITTLFKSYTNVGITGSGFEHGLQAAKMAVEKSLGGTNEALVRSDAFLAVIVVSDEEDDGIGLGMTDYYSQRNLVAEGLTTHKFTDNDMITYLTMVKGAGKFSVSAIAATRDTNGNLCTSTNSQPKEEGTQYINAAKKTGGIVQSICSEQWDQSLARIGYDINAQTSQVVLDGMAVSGSIKVAVNGQSESRWTYVAASNAVKFNADAVPAAGAKIKIEYKALVP